MNFFLVDDDEVIRSIVRHLIEDEDIGEVVGEEENGSQITAQFLNFKKVDILIMDLLMPMRDGIETIRAWNGEFHGKVIMLSQVESKELVGEAYTLGIDYFITKPINKNEVLAVINKVIQTIRMERTVNDISKTLHGVLNSPTNNGMIERKKEKQNISGACSFLLSELGIIGENGSKDLLEIVDFLFENEVNDRFEKKFPSMKDLFENISNKRLGNNSPNCDILRETKASEQRVRRAINASINHWASIGLTDFTNPKFENYALKFFDFSVIRNKMTELKNGNDASSKQVKIHTKRFIQVLYFESKKLIQSQSFESKNSTY